MEIKSHVFEIMQVCFLHAILLFSYLSVLLKPVFLKRCKNTWFSHAVPHVVERTNKADIRPEEQSEKAESCPENL